MGKLSLIYLLGKVLEVAGKVLPITFKSGKAFKNSRKGFSPKIPWERKGKGKVSVLPAPSLRQLIHTPTVLGIFLQVSNMTCTLQMPYLIDLTIQFSLHDTGDGEELQIEG